MPIIRSNSLPVQITVGILGAGIAVLAVLYVFHLAVILPEAYLFSLLGISTAIFFLTRRATSKGKDVIPWYDILIAVTGLAIGIYGGVNALNINMQGWEQGAPSFALIAGLALLAILLEGTRRSYGWLIFGLCAFFMLEPLFASSLPGPFKGVTFNFQRVMSFHVFGAESLLGSVSATTGRLLIGYLFFAGVLQISGGGKFFLDIALSLFGKTRGAPAKVSVVGSGLFGMLSGAPIPNILTTGAFTIPAMKKVGYAPHYAAAVEAVASSGGIIMPPVMGTAAFIMVGIVGIPYWSICVAAVVPAILYYVILFVQADSYAGRNNIRGLGKEETPLFWNTLVLGLPYIITIAVLVWFLAVARTEEQAPFYSILALFAASFIRKETRPTLKDLWAMFDNSVRLIADIFVLLFTLGLVVGALTLTGITTSLAYSLVDLVGDKTYLIPIMTMVAGYILGMGVPGVAVYLLLAISMAPALIKVGYPVLPSHLYLLFIGMLSCIVPPVALSSITAGKLAGVQSVFKVSFVAMRLGMGLFIVPLIFIFNPALLIGQAESLWQTVFSFSGALAGFILVSSAFENYLFRFKLKLWQSVILGLIGIVLIIIPIWLI